MLVVWVCVLFVLILFWNSLPKPVLYPLAFIEVLLGSDARIFRFAVMSKNDFDKRGPL